MRKIFTLALLAVLTLTVNAKSWDFTKWSSTSVALLSNSSDWTMDEKGNGSPYLTDNECLWNVNASQWDEEGYVTAGGMAIQELKGIQFTTLGAKGLAIGLNYPQTLDANKWGPYHGNQYLWVNKAANCTFVLKDIKPGITIKMGIESHKPSDGRGVDLDINGTALELISGQASCRPTTYEEFEWQVPNGDENVDITVKPNNGCHIYFIKCGDDEPVAETSKIGLLYNEAAGTAFNDLAIYKALKGNESFTIEGLKIDGEMPAADKLQSYDAIILDGSLPADNANLIALLKDNIHWQPVLNVNADIAEALGFGTKVAQNEGEESEMGVVIDKNKNWFMGFEGIDDVTGEGNYGYGLTMGEIWPVAMKLNGNHAKAPKQIVWMDADYAIHNDSVLAYAYCAGHNEYAYYGAKGDYNEGTETILQNILAELVSSKSDITAAKAPTFAPEYGDMQTTLTIKCSTPNAEIHYTTDGSEPTLSSPLYTVPVLFAEAVTVKAVAIADGYTIGNVAETTISLKHKAKAPRISITENGENGSATVTLSSDEQVDIYYNFTDSDSKNKSGKYTEPVIVKTPGKLVVTAWAEGNAEEEADRLVQSEIVKDEAIVNVKKIRRDIVAHFDANSTDWNEGSTATKYFFSWGKSAIESTIASDEPELDEDGNPKQDEYGDLIYKKTLRDPEVYKPTAAEDVNGDGEINDDDLTADQAWKLVSNGQVMTWENATAGTDVAVEGARNAAAPEDIDTEGLLTKYWVSSGARVSGDKYTARIESMRKFQGPFNILAFVGTNSKEEKTAFQISTDGKEWTTLNDDTLHMPSTQRFYKKVEMSYEGTDAVYVRYAHLMTGSKAYVFDLYIMNEGEKSKQMEEEYATGIIEITEAENKAPARFSNGTYNIAGQKVGKDYKGLVIKRGKKYVQK